MQFAIDKTEIATIIAKKDVFAMIKALKYLEIISKTMESSETLEKSRTEPRFFTLDCQAKCNSSEKNTSKGV